MTGGWISGIMFLNAEASRSAAVGRTSENERERKIIMEKNIVDTEVLKEVQERFSHDRFATVNGAVVEEVGEGYARCTMALDEHHYNAVGGVMGGAIFTLADFAFAIASNWNKPVCVSLTSQITYLGRAKGKTLIAEARKVKEGRTTCYYLVEITDELGSQVAHVTSSGFTSGKK